MVKPSEKLEFFIFAGFHIAEFHFEFYMSIPVFFWQYVDNWLSGGPCLSQYQWVQKLKKKMTEFRILVEFWQKTSPQKYKRNWIYLFLENSYSIYPTRSLDRFLYVGFRKLN